MSVKMSTANKTFTSERSDTLAYWAAMIAIESPRNQGTYSSDAKVSWEVVHKIRAELDAAGFDWRTACVAHKVAVAKYRSERRVELYPEDKANSEDQS